MVKLTTNHPSPHTKEIRVEGRLTHSTLDDLRAAVGEDPPTGSVVLDIAGVTSLDADGREYLRGMRRAGCAVRGASLYINSLLGEVPS